MSTYTFGNTSNPTSLVILLHGYGANGEDLMALAHEWAPHLPGTVFVSPDAPNKCDMTPFGYQWFGLGDWSPLTLSRGARDIAPWINEFIDGQLKTYHLDDSHLVLAGFSQGTMMALYLALRRPKKIAGVLGYSGALICTEEWDQIRLQQPDICLIHGIADNVVPVAAHYHAAQMLQAKGLPFEGHVLSGLMHGINDYGLKIGREFLARVLPNSAA
jgi:phospholipase/carboxylesterase